METRWNLGGIACIGLATARELAAAHGGSVAATNAPTGGAVFTVKLPAAPTAAPRQAE